MKTGLQLLLISILSTLAGAGWGQRLSELGKPFITSWQQQKYGVGSQAWCITQDHRGVMYIANNNGVLEYDGVSWRLIQLPNKSTCRSVACDASGRIYVGGTADFGYLAPDSVGQMRFISLLPQVTEDERAIGDVWKTHVLGQGILFETTKTLFRWTPTAAGNAEPAGNMKLWHPKTAFHVGNVVNGDFYIREWDKGLLRLEGDSLRLAPGGERFASERIYVMLPIPPTPPLQKGGTGRSAFAKEEVPSFNKAGVGGISSTHNILIGTRSQGFFIYDGQTFQPFKTEADDYLQQHRLYMPGMVLKDGRLVLNTLEGGLVVLDQNGKLVQIIDRDDGLPANTVYWIYSNPEQPETQWLALDDGIARVEAAGPFTYFDATSGLTDVIRKIQRHQGALYAATQGGIFYLDALSQNFKPLQEQVGHTLDLLSMAGQLLAATADGVYRISGNRAALVRKFFGAIVLHASRQDSQRVFVGLNSGLAALRLENGIWRDEGDAGIQDEVRNLVETGDGKLWAGTDATGVLRFTFPHAGGQSWQQAQVERFGRQHGLPEGGTAVYEIDGVPYFRTATAIYHFDEDKNTFAVDSTFMVVPSDDGWWLDQDERGRVWVVSYTGEVAMGTQKAGGSYDWLKAPFHRFKDSGIYRIYPEADGIIWLGGHNSIIRYDPAHEMNYALNYPALVRRVVAGRDSLIYGGGFAGRLSLATDENKSPPLPNGDSEGFASPIDLPHRLNNILFEYAAAGYEDPDKLLFQTRLEGLEDAWSNWNNKTEREFTNLPEGHFRFQVRAQNVYGQFSRAGIYEFTILPPWYRTWWACAVYVLAGAGFLFGFVKIRVRSLQKKTEELEAIVHARTREVTEQKEQLAEQAEKLREIDTLKSRFFANISHEFRTPLTLILGQTVQALETPDPAKNPDRLKSVIRNSQRLLELINQLLELSKFEAGKLQLRARPDDLVSFTKVVVSSFESLAEQRQTTLRFEAQPEEIDIYFDPERMEQVLFNLLSNAFKFTRPGGAITVSVNVIESEAAIVIADTGIGIAPDRLPYIFDRFYQVDSSHMREYEGTGIGLTLVQDLVQLHHGEISVASKEGKGTTFTIRLPLGRQHLSADEIATEGTATAGAKTTGVFVSGQEAPPGCDLPLQDGAETDPVAKPKKLVLIVEDNAEVRNYVREQLQTDYEILLAENGQQGLEKACAAIPDLIITDVMMPKMDGHQLAAALRTDERSSHIPIIMLTSKASDAAKIEGLETGVDAYLTKPFNARELQVRVRKLIQLREALRKRFSRATIIKPSEVTAVPVDREFLERVVNRVEQHFEDENFGAPELSKLVNMSASQLNRKLNALIGQPAGKLIRSLRLQRAADLLSQKAGSVAEIAYRVGFGDQAHFSRRFKEVFGTSPSEYTSGGTVT